MSLYTDLRTKATEALKSGNELEKNLFRTVIGEVERQSGGTCGKDVPDADVRKVIKKCVVYNRELIQICDNPGFDLADVSHFENIRIKAVAENEILLGVATEIMTLEQVREALKDMAETFRTCKSEGQAIGMANKTLVGLGKDYFGDDVSTVVKGLRA